MLRANLYTIENIESIVRILPGSEKINFLQNHKDVVLKLAQAPAVINFMMMLIKDENYSIKNGGLAYITSIIDILNPLFLKLFSFKDLKSIMIEFNKFEANYNCDKLLEDKKLFFISLMKDKIQNGNELVEILPFIQEKNRIKVINDQDTHWELVYRDKCRISFLGGEIREEASSHFFFKNDGDHSLRKKILSFTDLQAECTRKTI
jgi:hypothetical protein